MKNISQHDRKEFVDLLNYFIHPSEEISIPDQLKGRDSPLNQLRDVFETNGLNAFIWGIRGVGKTSLVHTACEKFNDTVQIAAAVSCQKDSSSEELLNDIFRRVVHSGKVKIKDRSIAAKVSLLGASVEGKLSDGFQASVKIESVNHASDFLNTILPTDSATGRSWVIIIDEFDQLENKKTIDFFTLLAKQISVDKLSVKFVFCGVASNLNDLVGSHESVDRYIKSIELRPLLDGHIMDIANYISSNFALTLMRGQQTRIAQISCGYPHFAHVIMKEILRVAYDAKFNGSQILPEHFKEGVQNASKGAAIRLQNAYEAATRKGTDKYIEVLWAAADGQLLDKQFKNIREDYLRIMANRGGRNVISDEQNLRNHLNSLCADSHGSVMRRGKVGWYRFTDPMFRSYVRMIAHNDDIDLGEESFRQ